MRGSGKNLSCESQLHQKGTLNNTQRVTQTDTLHLFTVFQTGIINDMMMMIIYAKVLAQEIMVSSGSAHYSSKVWNHLLY